MGVLDTSPLMLQARLQGHNEDSPTFKEVMQLQDDQQERWFKSMDKEIAGLHDKDCFHIVDLKAAIG